MLICLNPLCSEPLRLEACELMAALSKHPSSKDILCAVCKQNTCIVVQTPPPLLPAPRVSADGMIPSDLCGHGPRRSLCCFCRDKVIRPPRDLEITKDSVIEMSELIGIPETTTVLQNIHLKYSLNLFDSGLVNLLRRFNDTADSSKINDSIKNMVDYLCSNFRILSKNTTTKWNRERFIERAKRAYTSTYTSKYNSCTLKVSANNIGSPICELTSPGKRPGPFDSIEITFNRKNGKLAVKVISKYPDEIPFVTQALLVYTLLRELNKKDGTVDLWINQIVQVNVVNPDTMLSQANVRERRQMGMTLNFAKTALLDSPNIRNTLDLASYLNYLITGDFNAPLPPYELRSKDDYNISMHLVEPICVSMDSKLKPAGFLAW